MSNNTIFLFGAGLSRPAGIPTIHEMTKDFLTDPLQLAGSKFELKDSSNMLHQISVLTNLTSDYFGDVDLELMMSIVLQLEDIHFRKLVEKSYPELQEIYQDTN